MESVRFTVEGLASLRTRSPEEARQSRQTAVGTCLRPFQTCVTIVSRLRRGNRWRLQLCSTAAYAAAALAGLVLFASKVTFSS
jgi:hypothetical protein